MRFPRGPALPIIVVAGSVHVVRHNLLDSVVFLGAALLIVIDANLAVLRRAAPTPGGTGRTWLVITTAAAVAGAVLGLTGVGSIAARIVLAAAGAVGLFVVLRGPGDVGADDRARGWIAWAAVAVAICLTELYSFTRQVDPDTGNPAHPTLSLLSDPLLAATGTRALLFAGWAAGAVWLIRALLAGGRTGRRSPQ